MLTDEYDIIHNFRPHRRKRNEGLFKVTGSCSLNNRQDIKDGARERQTRLLQITSRKWYQIQPLDDSLSTLQGDFS